MRLAGARRPSFDARRLRRMAERNLCGFVRSRAPLSRAGEKLLFRALCRMSRERRLYEIYLERIAEFRESPPGPDWDGVYTFTTK